MLPRVPGLETPDASWSIHIPDHFAAVPPMSDLGSASRDTNYASELVAATKLFGMPVDFHFTKLSIHGFRGIRELDVDLPAAKPLHLIGGNNSGKTTILEAMALVLRGGGFHQFSPNKYDFFHDAAGEPVSEFTVTLHFGADDVNMLPAVQGVGNPVPVHGVQVRGNTNRSGRRTHRHLLLDGAGKAITYSTRTALKGDIKDVYRGRANLGWSQPYARLDDIRDDMPDVWLLTPQNLHRSLYEWKTGPLQRLSRMLAEQFLATEWEFEFDGKLRKMPDTMVKAHGFFRQTVEAFPFWQNDLRPKLQNTFSQYIGAQARFSLRPDVQQVEQWLAQQLAVSFAADAGGATTPLERMGDGWQSLVRLAALDVLSQYPGQVADRVTVLAEEPETYLHPHLRRKMRAVLERLAGQGWTVLTATHGPELVSFSLPQVVVRLWRTEDDVAKGVFDSTTATDDVRFQERLDERGNHEMLFANRAILCEGKDDPWAIRSALAKLDPNLDLDARSVSLVDTGGVGNVPDYADIARRLGIQWCAVTDEDVLPDGTIKPAANAAREKLGPLLGSGDLSVVWPVNLEACLGTPPSKKAKPDWQAANIDPKPLDQLQRDHPDFVATCKLIQGWL